MHDYQISWDYELDDKCKTEDKRLLKEIVKEIKRNILPILKEFKSFKVYPIILPNNQLAVYCNGTHSLPIIGIAIQNHYKACYKYGVFIEVALKSSILHELKHADQEAQGKQFNEREAEDFAYLHT